MTIARILMYVLAVLYAVLAGLTAMVGSFADGGDIWSRLLLVLLHPLCAAGMLVLAFVRGLTPAKLLGIAALLAGTVGADLFAAAQIAGGSVKGGLVAHGAVRRGSGHRGALRPRSSPDALRAGPGVEALAAPAVEVIRLPLSVPWAAAAHAASREADRSMRQHGAPSDITSRGCCVSERERGERRGRTQ